MNPLTASELFALVKDCPEVWTGTLFFSEMRIQWFSLKLATTTTPLPDEIATLTLLALFTLAAECGVAESQNGWRSRGAYYAFIDSGDEESPMVASGNHPLAAAVAAYKKGRANGQV